MSTEINRIWPSLHWSWKEKPYSYVVTPTDREWFIRCLWREGKPAETVGHTLLQRFALLASTRSKYASMTDFLRAYCQPVNPRWFPSGDLTLKALKRARARGDSARVQFLIDRGKRRMIYSSTPISAIPKRFVELADKILSGSSVSPAPEATHFSMSFAKPGSSEAIALQSARDFAKKRGLIHIPIPNGHKPGVNWFFVGKTSPPTLKFGTTAARTGNGIAIGILPIAALIFGWLKRRTS